MPSTTQWLLPPASYRLKCHARGPVRPGRGGVLAQHGVEEDRGDGLVAEGLDLQDPGFQKKDFRFSGPGSVAA
jgi:hypothetical protein